MKLASKIRFADEKIKLAFQTLEHSTTEDLALHGFLAKAFENIRENAFSGIQVPKKQIPNEYFRKYGIDNCWKYDLPKGWRLIYSVARDEIIVVSIILEWYDHKKYSRKFGYKTG